MAQWTVAMRVTRRIVAVIEADSAAQAIGKAECLDFDDEQVTDTVDWEVVGEPECATPPSPAKGA